MENFFDIFSTSSDEYQHPNFTNITPHNPELEQLTKTNIVNYSNSKTPETRNISIVPPYSSTTVKCKEKGLSQTDCILIFKLQPLKSDNNPINSSFFRSSTQF